MNFISFEFLAFSVFAIVAMRLRPRGFRGEIVIFALNFIFIASFYSSPLKALPLLSFLVLGYAAIAMAKRFNTVIVLSALIAAIVAVFVWLKQYTFIAYVHPLREFPYHVIGLSYVLFRIIHLVVDVAQGAAETPSPLRYTNYCLFFLNFVSGPIQRYQDYSAEIDKTPPPITADVRYAAMQRIILGVLMVFIISSSAIELLDRYEVRYYDLFSVANEHRAITLTFAKICVIYLINIYANFAGYMHIIIGIGQLAGVRIPENFDKPYVSKNFLDLWARWHITLSQWFKFYLFNPLFKVLSARVGTAENTPYLGALCFFVTFLVMGIWHGSTLIFVLYGLFLGFGATINKLWQVALAKTFCKNCYKNLTAKAWYFQLSRAMTLSYFAVGLTCLWLPSDKIYMLLSRHGMTITVSAFVLLSVAGAVAGALVDGLVRRTVPFFTSLTASYPQARMITQLAFEIAIIALILLYFDGTAPEFIYKIF